MPWVPKKDALRKYREAAGFTVSLLAQRVGISERQLRKIESEKPPGTVFGANLYALASVLGCTKEDLGTWVARRPTKATETTAPKRRGRPRVVTLEQLARMERDYRRAGELPSGPTETAHGSFELLGAERMVELQTQFGAYEGRRYLIVGRVEQHKPLPIETWKLFGIESGVGGRFQLSRDVFYGMPLSVTILTVTPELTTGLLDHVRNDAPASVIVRVHVARPKNRWKGFISLEKDARPAPYSFVVEKIIS